MTKHDYNGVRIKPGHNGFRGINYGDGVWLLRRNDDKLYGVWSSRHDAIAARATTFRGYVKPQYLEPIYVPVGSVRIPDVKIVSDNT